ncbi:MAG TPA: glycosyltransferase family 2 protein [Anaerolineae bacterium]|nr:glycosyltransferase family 2 protein [Anaerolineae bacterium]
MKLVIQIPCLNEANTLPETLADLPRQLPGIDEILILIINDGSTDDTVDVAIKHGVHHIVHHTHRRGLAQAFQTGLDTSLRLGADIIVNTDADNQYNADSIADLIIPLINHQADIVIGDRQVDRINHFSPLKKRFQRLGSSVVRTISGTDVPDTVSGFRAYSREAALRLTILSQYSYTLESIIQASKMGLHLVSVPVKTNGPTRPSRLQKNMWHFMKAQGSTILRVYAFYEPLRTFFYIAIPFLTVGLFLLLRFFYHYFDGLTGVARYVQSVAIGTGFFIAGIFIALFGIQADIASKHRQLTQATLYRLKKMDVEQNPLQPDYPSPSSSSSSSSPPIAANSSP